MPPKKGQEVSKKAVQKEAKQIIEDKTFGLKNKNKSKKVQEYCVSIEKNVKQKTQQILDKNKPSVQQSELQKAEKEAERQAQQMALLRQTLKQPKVPEGEDPKSFPCVWFQYGCCDKGDKCRFSHGQKTHILTEQEIREEKLRREVETEQKRLQEMGFASEDMGSLDVYREMRDQILEFKARQQAIKNGRDYAELLRELQQRERDKNRTIVFSEKICDFFVQACRDGTIGFGWVCPNEKTGAVCQYRHWLPEGFELFRREDMDEDLDYEELEDRIERQRAEILQGTPVTTETFRVWKDLRVARQREERDQEEARKEKEGGWTGRQIFEKGLYKRDADLEAAADAAAAQEDDALMQWKREQRRRAEEDARIEAEAEAKAQQLAEDEEKQRHQPPEK